LQAVHRLEGLAGVQQELLSQARGIVRALLGLCVPWRLYIEAMAVSESIAISAGTRRFATLSLETRLQLLRASVAAAATGESMLALQSVVQQAAAAFEVLRIPQSVTGKQAALLKAATAAQNAGQDLCIACANRSTQRAIQTFLGEHDIDVIRGHLHVMTRGQVRRAVAEGRGLPASTLLVTDPLGIGSEFYLSGIASCVRLIAYDLERETVDRQLRYNARDIHRASEPWGDKRAWIVDEHRADAVRSLATVNEAVAVGDATEAVAEMAPGWISVDSGLDASPPLWDVEYSLRPEEAVLPRTLPQGEEEPFVLPNSDWVQEVLRRIAEAAGQSLEEGCDGDSGADDDSADESSTHVSLCEAAADGVWIEIALADGEAPTLLAPASRLLLLRNAPQDLARGAGLEDLERTGEGIILASEVRADMMVLIPRRMTCTALLYRLLERFSLSADYLTAAPFQQMYLDAVALLALGTEASAAKAFSLLVQHGVPVTSAQTVLRWMQGLVVGPRDVASIRAVGLATGRSELVRHDTMIHAAQAHIRSCLRALALSIIENLLAGRLLGPDVVLDKRFGMRRADLDEVARSGRVTHVRCLDLRTTANAAR
jgi:hypothetical protein